MHWLRAGQIPPFEGEAETGSFIGSIRLEMSAPRLFRSLILLLLLAAGAESARAAVWQYSVPFGNDPARRAYLWIPENCRHVRGVFLGVQNMLEQLVFEDPTIRKAVADAGLAIVWISPGNDIDDKRSTYFRFDPGDEVVRGVEKALADLAGGSGYSEIASAPLLVTAHSAATPFVWGMANALGPSRVIAILPIKGWLMGLPPGVPALHVAAEYAEVGGANWGDTVAKDLAGVAKIRAGGADRLIGEFADVGAGHFEWNPDAAAVVGMFIRKAAQYRLPANPPASGSVALTPIDPRSGWLIDPAKVGTPQGRPMPASQWPGDPAKALWYFDREMAQAVNDAMAAQLAKKPQVIDFLDEQGLPIPLANGGCPVIPAQLLPDGVTFKVRAAALDKSPTERLYNGATVGHASGPIFFKASTGAIRQTGPDTFRIWMKRGSAVRQGPPWEPWIIAWQPGDATYRRADRPGRPNLPTISADGKPQTITFAKIPDRRYGPGAINLHATTDAGLPVQFFVVSGPAELRENDNSTLEFLPAPPRSKFPMKVIVGAYQWGRRTEPKVRTAGPVFQEFLLTK
jgi:hypothetical protein